MATSAPPRAATSHYAASAALAARAAAEAKRARPRGLLAIVQSVIRYQAAHALLSEQAVGQMLEAQGVDVTPQARLIPTSFTTETNRMLAMIDATATVDAEFDRLVESLVQDAARAAESVAVTVRPRVQFVRYLNPPSCSRCAVLAGRVYRYSDGFLRHPNCDCIMLPATVAAPDLVQDPAELAKQGLVTGLSKADLRALADGADFNQLVNVRRSQAGLRQAGRVLGRNGRPTPEAIYATTNSREEAIQALAAAGYVL